MVSTAMESWRQEAAGQGRARRNAAMPLARERVTPWLAASCIIGAVNAALLLSGAEPANIQVVGLTVALGGTLAAGGLVAARSSRQMHASDLEERARPSTDELVGGGATASNPSYVDGMEQWATAMLELIEHAVEVASPEDPAQPELATAAADTQELRELLRSSGDGPLSIHDKATLHALCSLWETNQVRVEHLAGQIDAAWHRRWRARTVVQRRLRHGERLNRTLALPYR